MNWSVIQYKILTGLIGPPSTLLNKIKNESTSPALISPAHLYTPQKYFREQVYFFPPHLFTSLRVIPIKIGMNGKKIIDTNTRIMPIKIFFIAFCFLKTKKVSKDKCNSFF